MTWILVLAWCTGAVQGVNVCSTVVIPKLYAEVSECRQAGQRAMREGMSAYRCVAP